VSVTLRKRTNRDGSKTLFLAIYHEGRYRYEFLKHLKLYAGTSPDLRQKNRESLELAKKITVLRAQELSAHDYDMPNDNGKKTVIADWMQSFIDAYKLKDKRNLQGALNRFTDFLGSENKMTFGRINVKTIEDYRNYLKSTSKGEGASSYFARFKKMMKAAYQEGLINRNPVLDIEKKKLPGAKKKDTLTLQEIQLLAATPIENDAVKRAFLFCTVTGLRWVDVSQLTWTNIHDRTLTIRQAKTGLEVSNNLNDTALKLIGKPGEMGDQVFELPTANGANKTLKAWVKRAGITKQITWHNARHSFGTNLIYQGADVLTVSSMLGHASMKYTQRYVTASRELKNKASDKLNFDL
jgi:integrase/recombinase XerD